MIVEPSRLVKPYDEFYRGFPDMGFRGVYSFQTVGEPVLITDPVYLADVYNSMDEVAIFLRMHGVFVMNFGGDVSGPIYWQMPFVLLPISIHLSDEDFVPPAGAIVLASEVGTDSGSFVFLPMTKDMPIELKARIDDVLTGNNGALLRLPAGHWSVFYEQWDVPEGKAKSLYRNIVLKWEPLDVQSAAE